MNGPALVVDIALSNGQVMNVVQPTDGLTDMIVESFENRVWQLEDEVYLLDKEVTELTEALDDDYNTVLTDPVENDILAYKALSFAGSPEFSPAKRALYSILSLTLLNLSVTK